MALKQEELIKIVEKILSLFCMQVADRRKMRHEFDNELGKVRYVNVEREKVTQIVVYSKKNTIFVTMEPEITLQKKTDIINNIKKLTSNL